VNDYFALNIGCLSISVHKASIFLKIALFLWTSASSGIMTFYMVFLKQAGFTIKEVFLAHSIFPLIQVLIASSFVVSPNKCDKPKQILILNLILTSLSGLTMTYMPSVETSKYENHDFDLFYHPQNETWTTNETICDGEVKDVYLDSCSLKCSDKADLKYIGHGNIILPDNNTLHNSFSVSLNNFRNSSEVCSVSVNFSSETTQFYSDYKNWWNYSCYLSCSKTDDVTCFVGVTKRNAFVIIYAILITIFMITYSNVFRVFDVTMIHSAKEYKATYEQLRLWTNIGALAGPFLAGIAVKITTISGHQNIYSGNFYAFIFLCVFTAVTVCKVQIHKIEPATKIWEKTKIISKSPDAMVFFLVLFLLGTSWGFNSMYLNWYLAEIETTVFLFSIINSMKSLYGIPFLFLSKWFFKKMGETSIFLQAFTVYATAFFGYSFLQTAWPALLLEINTVFTYHLLWEAVMSFCNIISPKGLVDIINMSTGSLHYTI
ncbi:MFS_1_like domain-containing protein, partial [Nephila pilipes]